MIAKERVPIQNILDNWDAVVHILRYIKRLMDKYCYEYKGVTQVTGYWMQIGQGLQLIDTLLQGTMYPIEGVHD